MVFRMSEDETLERSISRVMTCAPINCPRELDCFRVALFARDQMRMIYAKHHPVEAVTFKPFSEVATWEVA